MKVVQYYRQLRDQVSEKKAVELTLARWQPTQPEHFPLCASSIRQWHRTATQEGFAALRPKSTRPHTIQYHVPDLVVGVIFTLRYLAAVAGTAATTEWVARVAQAAIQRAGPPQELVSDNGREFVSVWEAVLTQFGRLWADCGIEHLNSAPHYPQGNGKAEAFIKILNREVLTGRTFDTLAELQTALDRYLTFYNNYRRHSALGWQTPASRYTGQALTVRGVAGIPGLEGMAADPQGETRIATRRFRFPQPRPSSPAP